MREKSKINWAKNILRQVAREFYISKKKCFVFIIIDHCFLKASKFEIISEQDMCPFIPAQEKYAMEKMIF